MKALWITVSLTSAAVLAFAAPKGTVPLSSADHYPAHVQRDGVSIGAKLLTPDQVRRTFVSDLKRCCQVVELALYPQAGKPLDVSVDSFTIRAVGAETAVRASSPKLVAASLQKGARAERDITVSPVVGVGYSSGRYYDPVTGTVQGGGVTTQAGVGVGIGGAGSAPASTAQDRATMELELRDKGLPEGTTSAPVSGYVYFPISSKKKRASYQLEYMLNGEKVVLPLSQ
jgi:hypothetical protein